jgi:thiol-disulfide isomerase/thioredoxin
MSTGLIFLLVIAGLLAAWLLFTQFGVVRLAREARGRAAPDTPALDGAAASSSRVYYFYAAHCGHCRALTPRMRTLATEHPNLVVLDIAAHRDLAQAFGVAATPAFCHVRDGTIQEVRLGAVRESWLRAALAEASR